MNSQITNTILKRSPIREERFYYSITFLLIFISCAYRNERILLYSFEFLYIVAITAKAFKENIKLNMYALWSGIFIVIIFLSTIYALDKAIALKQAFNVFKVFLIGNSLVLFINGDRKKLNFILYCFIISALYLTLLLLINTPSYAWGRVRIGDSIGMNANAVGLIMSIAAIISIYFWRIKKRILFLVMPLGFIVVTIMSGSRKAIVLIAIGFIIMLFSSMRRSGSLILIFPLFIIFMYGLWYAVVSIPELYNVLGMRLELMIGGFLGKDDIDYSTLSRLGMIDTGIELFKSSPIFGHGVHSFSVLTPHAYAHNNYVELLVSIGLLGTITYYTIYIIIVYNLFRKISRHQHASLFLALLLGLAIMEFGLVTYYVSIYQILIASAYAATKIQDIDDPRQ